MQPYARRVIEFKILATNDEGHGTSNAQNYTYEEQGIFSSGISGGSFGMGASDEARNAQV